MTCPIHPRCWQTTARKVGAHVLLPRAAHAAGYSCRRSPTWKRLRPYVVDYYNGKFAARSLANQWLPTSPGSLFVYSLASLKRRLANQKQFCGRAPRKPRTFFPQLPPPCFHSNYKRRVDFFFFWSLRLFIATAITDICNPPQLTRSTKFYRQNVLEQQIATEVEMAVIFFFP